MNIWNILSDPKYDTVFAIVKTIAAFVTFVAGVIGIYSGQTLRDSRLTRLGGVLIALLLVGTSLSIVIQLRQDDAQQIALQQQRANFGKEQAAIDKEQVGIVALRNASHDLLRETENIKHDSEATLGHIRRTNRDADTTISRLNETDTHVQSSVRAARESLVEDESLDRKERATLSALKIVDEKNGDAIARLKALNQQTKTLADESEHTLRAVHDQMYPILQPSGLHLGFNYEFDARSPNFASVVQNFEALIADYNEHCQPQSTGSTIYRDTGFNFQDGRLASVEAFKHSGAFPTNDMLNQWFGAVQLDISFYSSQAQGHGTLGKSDLDLQVQAVPEVNEQAQSNVTYWPSRHTLSLYQYADAPKFTPANGTIAGVDDLEGTRMVAQISRPPSVARKFSTSPSLGEFAFFVSGRRFVFNAPDKRPSFAAPQYDVTMPDDPRLFSTIYEPGKADESSAVCDAPASRISRNSQ